MSYVVLARKWRPRFFEEVVGQGHVARTLKNSIEQDRVAHAYLFTGARGVGKTSTARILAKALNCHKGPAQTPCYECPSCVEVSQGQSIDVFEIDGASNRGINEIRELREGVRYAPNRDRYKIYIIDEVHMLTTEAFNALLKTLEEPPPHVKFIFATTEPQKIPVTILSRCQRFDFKRINQHDIVEHLLQICPSEGIEAEKAALQLIARQASGGMRDALSLLDQVISFAGQSITEEQVTQILGVANRKHLFALSAAIVERDAESALLALDDVHRYGYDLQQFASEMVSHLRDLMVARVVENPERVTSLTESELALLRPLIAPTPPDLLHRYFSVMIDGAQEMSRSPYPKLVFEMALVRMCQLEPLVSIDLMVERLRALEGALGDEPFDPEPKKKSEHVSVLPARPMAIPAPAPQPTEASTAPVAVSTPAPQPAAMPPAVVQEPAPAAPAPEPAAGRPLWEKPEPPEKPSLPPAPAEPEVASQPAPAEPLAAQEPPASLPDEEPEAPSQEDAPPWVLDEEEEQWSQYEEQEDEESGEPLDLRAMADEVEPAARSYEVFSMSGTARRRDLPDLTLVPEDDDGESGPPPAPQLDVAKLGRQQSWRELVGYVRLFQAPLAATLEHAYVEEFTQERLLLRFIERYLHFVNDAQRVQPLRHALDMVFGEAFELNIALRHDATPLPGFETLAQLREAQLRARRDKLARDTENHPVIKSAEALFTPNAMRVLVALHED